MWIVDTRNVLSFLEVERLAWRLFHVIVYPDPDKQKRFAVKYI